MATILSTLYPPLIDTFMPAFPNTDSAVAHFTVSPYNSTYDIQYLHVTLVNQKTNKNAFSTEANIETPEGTALINGIWILPFSESLNGDINPYLEMDRANNYFTLYIPRALLKANEDGSNTFNVNSYYKLQLRFDKYVSTDNSWSITQANSNYISEKRAYFSEWSSVCLLKAIPEITVHFNNFTYEPTENYGASSTTAVTNLPSTTVVPSRVPQYMPGIIPFAGNLTFAGNNDNSISKSANSEYYQRDIRTTSNDEYLMSYRITVQDQLGNLVKDSKIQYPSKDEKTNTFYWLCDMTEVTPGADYNVTLNFTTNNQYTFSKTFTFTLMEPTVTNFDPKISFNKIPLKAYGIEEQVLVTSEDGWVDVTVQWNGSFDNGYLFIKRATSLTDFKEWELLDCYYNDNNTSLTRTITDKTISSLVGYKYACQYLTVKGSWSQTVISPEIVYPDFHDILLSRGDKQLAVRYNPQIASLTPVVSRVKIDTLGGRYPKFAENAKLHYKQFQLSGLITAESDFNRTFLNDLDYNDDMDLYNDKMNGQYQIRNDTVQETEIMYGIDSDGNIIPKYNGTYSAEIESADADTEILLRDTQKNTRHDLYPKDNWWWERKFREEVMEWLNDGEPKLYRSMTEGNLIVMLDSISLTPNAQLGRRIWNFSCTVYEVGDGNSLEQLDALGIYSVVNSYSINLTSDQGITTENTNTLLGQTYRIKASPNGTNLIHTGEYGDDYGYVSIINSNGELDDKVKALSIGDQIGNLYTGLYQNFDFDTSTIRLKDVKIQFESLPQWYDLDSMSPSNYAIGGLYLTIQRNDELVDIVVDENYRIVEVKNNAPLWVQEGMTITDFLSDWETKSGNTYYKIEDEDQHIYTTVSSDDYESETFNYYRFKLKEEDGTEYYTKDGKNYISKAELKGKRFTKESNNNSAAIYTAVSSDTSLPTNEEDWAKYYILVDKSPTEEDLVNNSEFYDYIAVNNEPDSTQYKRIYVDDKDYFIETPINTEKYLKGRDSENSQSDIYNEYFKESEIETTNEGKKTEYKKITWDNASENNSEESNFDFYLAEDLDKVIYKRIENPAYEEYKEGREILKESIDSLNNTIEDLYLQLEEALKQFEPSEEEDIDPSSLTPEQQARYGLYKDTVTQIKKFWTIYTDFQDIKQYFDKPNWQDKLRDWLTAYNLDGEQELMHSIEEGIEITGDLDYIKYTSLFEPKIESYVLYKLCEQEYLDYRDTYGCESIHLIDVANELANELKEIESLQTKIFYYAIIFNNSIYQLKEWGLNNITELETTTNSLQNYIESLQEQIEAGNLTNIELEKAEKALQKAKEEQLQHQAILDQLKGGSTDDSGSTDDNGSTDSGSTDSGSTDSNSVNIIDEEELTNITNTATLFKAIFEKIDERDSQEKIWAALNEKMFQAEKKNIYHYSQEKIKTILNGESINTSNDIEIEFNTNTLLLENVPEELNNYSYFKYTAITEETIEESSEENNEENPVPKITIKYLPITKQADITEEDYDNIYIWDNYFEYFINLSILKDEILENISNQYVYLGNSPEDDEACPFGDESSFKQIKEISNENYFKYNESQYILYDTNDETRYYKISNINSDTNIDEFYISENDWEENNIYYYHINDSYWEIGTDIDKDSILIFYKKINKKYKEESSEEEEISEITYPHYVVINTEEEYEYPVYIRLKRKNPNIDDDYTNYEFKLLTEVLDYTNEFIYVNSYNSYVSKGDTDKIKITTVLGPGNQLIRVNTDTGEDLTITRPEDTDSGIISAQITDFIDNQIKRKNYGLGYKLQLKLASPHNPGAILTRTIFVNERGYYQVPSNMIVKEIKLFDEAVATLDYILEYDLTYNDVTEPNSYEVSESIVGQISGEWDHNTSIAPIISKKYWAYDQNNSTITQQMVDYWKAISFDGTPYTILDIQPTGTQNSMRYIVGRSGVLNLQTDYPTLNMYIAGKRMVQVPITRQPYLDEWEYVIDESVYTGKQDSESEDGFYWWVVYNNQTTEETDVIVKIHLETPKTYEETIQIDEDSSLTVDVLEFDAEEAKVIADTWYSLEDTHYTSTEILDPKPNTIYGIVNTLGVIEYKIYYLDRGWFNVTFPNIADNDYSIAYAQVPVYGMIDYRANIIKKLWS